MDKLENQDPLGYLALLDCQAEMDIKEIRETKAAQVFREKQDRRVTLELLDSLVSLVYQALMDRKEKGDNRVPLASEVKKVLWEKLATKEIWET